MLVMALIMLVLLAILAGISIRGASSTEQVANQSRLRELARQTAEAALLFCEQQVRSNALVPEAAPMGSGKPFSWETLGNWDATPPSANLKTVTVAAAGDTGGAVYFTRPAECMSQYMSPSDNKTFVTTARGFGPEVGAKTNTNPPEGTEIWLQSIVIMN